LTSGKQANYSRRFDPASPSLYLRVERQVLWPFPEQQAALFTIRTYISDCQQLCNDSHRKKQLSNALKSMSRDQLKYKGIDKNLDPILEWLGENNHDHQPSKQLRTAIRQIYRRG
jgi:hypothetical protein